VAAWAEAMIENPVKWVLHEDERCGGECGGNSRGNCGGLGAHPPDAQDPRGRSLPWPPAALRPRFTNPKTVLECVELLAKLEGELPS